MDYKRALEILELSKNFTKEELQKQHKILAKKYHPDNCEFGDEKRFIEVQEAYKYLSKLDSVNKNPDTENNTSKGETICPMCNGYGWRREKIKTSRGYVAQKVECDFCNELGRK